MQKLLFTLCSVANIRTRSGRRTSRQICAGSRGVTMWIASSRVDWRRRRCRRPWRTRKRKRERACRKSRPSCRDSRASSPTRSARSCRGSCPSQLGSPTTGGGGCGGRDHGGHRARLTRCKVSHSVALEFPTTHQLWLPFSIVNANHIPEREITVSDAGALSQTDKIVGR